MFLEVGVVGTSPCVTLLTCGTRPSGKEGTYTCVLLIPGKCQCRGTGRGQITRCCIGWPTSVVMDMWMNNSWRENRWARRGKTGEKKVEVVKRRGIFAGGVLREEGTRVWLQQRHPTRWDIYPSSQGSLGKEYFGLYVMSVLVAAWWCSSPILMAWVTRQGLRQKSLKLYVFFQFFVEGDDFQRSRVLLRFILHCCFVLIYVVKLTFSEVLRILPFL